MTMKSLARALGVSVTTISNAYSHPERLSAELRERILATGEALGYSGPDAAGRLLRSGRAMTVGVLCGDGYSSAFDDHRSAALLRGISRELEGAGVALQLLSSGAGEQDADAVARAAVDAIICLTPRIDTPPVLLARRRGIPLVHTAPVDEGAFVGVDAMAGARMLATALTGHDEAVVVGDLDDAVFDEFRAAFPGDVRRLAHSADSRVLDEVIMSAGCSSVLVAGNATIAARLDALLARWTRDRPALVCLDIPDATLQAHLAGVVAPVVEQGRRCARLALDPDALPRQTVLPVRLQHLSSSAARPGTSDSPVEPDGPAAGARRPITAASTPV